jgi:micrococcal nuclease
MASPTETPKEALRLAFAGVVVVGFALAYQYFGWTFLNTPEHGGISEMQAASVGTYYRVTKVTDGDTLHVDMDGTDERVRLIGINTPETVDPRKTVECFGKEASERMKSLAEGKNVRLEYDDSQSLRDTYGRLLAYVYLEDGQMLNKKMVAEGYAYEYTYLAPYAYQKEFRELQNLARTSGRGLWNPEMCNGTK